MNCVRNPHESCVREDSRAIHAPARITPLWVWLVYGIGALGLMWLVGRVL